MRWSLALAGFVAALSAATHGTLNVPENWGKRIMPLSASETERSNWLGRRVAAGDIDGDGYEDLVVTEPSGDPAGLHDAGIIHVIYGSASFFQDLPDTASIRNPGVRTTVICGDTSIRGDFLMPGNMNLIVADVDRDGYDDIISVSGVSPAIIVIYGGPNLPDTIYLKQTSTYRHTILHDNWSTDAALGDINGDGNLDIVISEPGYPSPSTQTGAVSIVFGPASDWPDSFYVWSPPAGVRVGKLYGGQDGDRLGDALACTDFNLDGYDDIFVYAPGADTFATPDIGVTYYVFGKADFPDTMTLSPYTYVNVVGKIYNTSNTEGSPEVGLNFFGDGRGDVVFHVGDRNLMFIGYSGNRAKEFDYDNIPLPHIWFYTSSVLEPGAEALQDINFNGTDEIFLQERSNNTRFLVYGYPYMPQDYNLDDPPDALGLTRIESVEPFLTDAEVCDLDGDGVRDLVFGAPFDAGISGVSGSGMVIVYKGARPDTPRLIFPEDGAFFNKNQVPINFTWYHTSLGMPPGNYRVNLSYNYSTDYAYTTETTQTYTPSAFYNSWSVSVLSPFDSIQSEVWEYYYDTVAPYAPTLEWPDSASAVPGLKVDFAWEEVFDDSPVEYVFQASTDSTFSTTLLVETTANPYLDTVPFPDEGVYYWRVMAYDAALNQSDWSSVWSFEIDTLAPEQVQLVEPDSGAWFAEFTQLHRWNPVTSKTKSPVSYVVQIDTSESFSSPLLVDTLSEDTLLYTAPFEGVFYWRVMAFDAAGHEGPWSNTWLYGVDTTAPAQVSLLSPPDSSTLSDSIVVCSWEAVEKGSPVSYVLEADTNPDFPQPFVQDTTDATEDTLSITLEDTWIYWRVKALDAAGNEGAWSSVWRFMVKTQGAQEGAPTTFFLKPTLGALSFGVPAPSELSLKVYDAQGRLALDASGLYQPGYYALRPALKPGVYFVRMEAPGSVLKAKLLVR